MQGAWHPFVYYDVKTGLTPATAQGGARAIAGVDDEVPHAGLVRMG